MSLQQDIEKNTIIANEFLDETITILDGICLQKYAVPWEYNRNLNTDKILEIVECIKNKSVLNTMIHCFVKNDQLVVFDGNHRVQAIIKFCKYNINVKVICYIYKYCSEQDIIQKFKLINESTPIPDINMDILEDLSNQKLVSKKDIIYSAFLKFKKDYPKMYSSHTRCNKPHFNDTKFMNYCNQFDFKDEEELLKILHQNNIKCCNSLQTKSTKIAQAKANLYQLYLFL